MLAIAGGKGGTGKTTTALGLARALDGPATVVDADVDMPDLHLLAGVDREPTLAAVADGATPASVAQPRPDAPTVSVLPAPAQSRDGRRDVGPALARLAEDAPPGRVLVDCPGGAGPDAAAALRAADRTVVVTSPCSAALRDATKTAAMARAVETDVVGAVVTRARAVPEAATALLGCPVLGSVPALDPPVLPREPARRAYRRIAAGID